MCNNMDLSSNFQFNWWWHKSGWYATETQSCGANIWWRQHNPLPGFWLKDSRKIIDQQWISHLVPLQDCWWSHPSSWTEGWPHTNLECSNWWGVVTVYMHVHVYGWIASAVSYCKAIYMYTLTTYNELRFCKKCILNLNMYKCLHLCINLH